MLALSDEQLEILMAALRQLPTETQRAHFLQLIGEQLRVRSVDVAEASRRALNVVTLDASA